MTKLTPPKRENLSPFIAHDSQVEREFTPPLMPNAPQDVLGLSHIYSLKHTLEFPMNSLENDLSPRLPLPIVKPPFS